MLEEAKIIDGCIRGDKQCIALLYKSYASSLYAVALRYTRNAEEAQDVLHDAFFLILDNLEQYEGRSSLYTWLARIVINQALFVRKKQLNVMMEDYEDYEEIIADETITDSDKLTHKALLGFIRGLTPVQQTMFNLCEIEGYSYKEVAQTLNSTEAYCRKVLCHAKNTLRKKVNEFFRNENK